MQPSHVDHFVRALSGAFYIDSDTVHDAIRQRTSFNLIHLETTFKVDVFIQKSRAFDKAQLERRVAQVIAQEPERRAYLATAEGTILTKLEWFRMDGEVSERQWSDILGILKVQAEGLDSAYLRHWAAELGLSDLLARALDDAGAV